MPVAIGVAQLDRARDTGVRAGPERRLREGAHVVDEDQVRAFGAYSVMVDTLPPSITNVDLKADMAGRSRFTFKVADDLSGVEKYKATIDGQWVLMEYEPKTKSLIHTFDAHSKGTGNRAFKLEVTDERGNTARYEQVFKH